MYSKIWQNDGKYVGSAVSCLRSARVSYRAPRTCFLCRAAPRLLTTPFLTVHALACSCRIRCVLWVYSSNYVVILLSNTFIDDPNDKEYTLCISAGAPECISMMQQRCKRPATTQPLPAPENSCKISVKESTIFV